uniref:Antimicrobial-peptide n=1 Tax=Alligator sinensis TaxID=38654 RepID=A0A2H4ZLD6_ALLSI|nr:antimicrobial-peptide [Alligator sinensis]
MKSLYLILAVALFFSQVVPGNGLPILPLIQCLNLGGICLISVSLCDGITIRLLGCNCCSSH